MESRNVVDVSCFLLFEDSGDSEADFDPIMAVDVAHDNNVADDDAESCSCDLSDCERVCELKDLEVQEYFEDSDDDDYEGEVNSYGQSYSGEQKGLTKIASGLMMAAGQDQKSRAGVDSAMEMNEMERNRLFWETCLAS
ncbi:hypothetical protein L1049_005075 [Liquidambar formosana]|uniref:Uncharacterized protein n=1 Tax=Liquidambar formosana TaxID=63359 RepID=A0AAP0RQN7_LIQFO